MECVRSAWPSFLSGRARLCSDYAVFLYQKLAYAFRRCKNDIAFRKIFGNEQKTAPLISFLNASLELEGNHQVVSVTIANPYQFPRIAGEKATILDVRATGHISSSILKNCK